MQIFDWLAGTKCLAGMFEIWFRAVHNTLGYRNIVFHFVPANANF